MIVSKSKMIRMVSMLYDLRAVLVITVMLISGCEKATINLKPSSGRKVQSRGVTYIIPIEESVDYTTVSGYHYKGESVIFAEVGGSLIVGTNRFGTVKAGDIVSIRTSDAVEVNGITRKPVNRGQNPTFNN